MATDTEHTGAGDSTSMTAAIHDLGYKSYIGSRKPQHTRWRVIVRNVLATSWRGWWRWRIWLGVAVIVMIVIGVLMERLQDKTIKGFTSAAGFDMNWADVLIPMSFDWFTSMAFVLSLTIGAMIVGKDLASGAFEFYFARPVRPIDYVAGKVVGMVLITATVLLAIPVMLTALRVGLSNDTNELQDALILLPQSLGVGLLASVAYAIGPMMFCAVAREPRSAMAWWAGFYIFVGGMIQGIALGIDVPELMVLDLKAAVMTVVYGTYDTVPQGVDFPPIWLGIAACLGYIALGLAAVNYRVKKAQREGMGGG
jgi:ABC-type transport system involved in multi-copper enzyme maturation permease subunit